MKALLICPPLRPAVALLAENHPLAVAPLLGKTLVEYWIEALAARGATEIILLASDRPDQVRSVVGDGTRWGLRLELIPQYRELDVAEARARYQPDGAAGWLPDESIILMDHLPGQPELPLFANYAGWFAALQAWLPRAITPTRIGMHEIRPGVWVGLHAQISPSARLLAPCWIGEHALVGPGAVIGPHAVLEHRVIVEPGAHITDSLIGPETFVGRMISVQRSLVQGGTVVNWQSESCLQVPDAFMLCSLDGRRFRPPQSGVAARTLALLAMLATAPAALAVMGLSCLRGEPPVQLRLGTRPQRHARRSELQTFTYHELACAGNWLRRWPQFWSVVRGDLTWFGNRPLRPTQALALANDFERLWLAAPVGLVSLADAHGCPCSDVTDEACAHASYYAVNASWRLDWFILQRSFVRAAAAWPIRWPRRKHRGVHIPQLLPKQQG